MAKTTKKTKDYLSEYAEIGLRSALAPPKWTDRLVEDVIYAYLNYCERVEQLPADAFIALVKRYGIKAIQDIINSHAGIERQKIQGRRR